MAENVKLFGIDKTPVTDLNYINDYLSAKKIGKVKVGDRALYYKEGLKKLLRALRVHRPGFHPHKRMQRPDLLLLQQLRLLPPHSRPRRQGIRGRHFRPGRGVCGRSGKAAQGKKDRR
jgi:hypothetical protein